MPTDNIRGFSQTHVSGTGGGAKYGNILVMPTTGDARPLDAGSPRVDERASAGLYSVTLARYSIGVDITAARRSAIYRFHYPQGAPANLLFDVTHCLISGARQSEDQHPHRVRRANSLPHRNRRINQRHRRLEQAAHFLYGLFLRAH